MRTALTTRAGHLTSARQVQRWRRGRGGSFGRRAGVGWPPLSAARWLRGQRSGVGGREGVSAGPSPASQTQCPGNLGTSHRLRSFTKHIVPIITGPHRRITEGVKEKSGPGPALEEPSARSLPAGMCDGNSPPPRAPKGGKPRNTSVLPQAAVWELSTGEEGASGPGLPGSGWQGARVPQLRTSGRAGALVACKTRCRRADPKCQASQILNL